MRLKKQREFKLIQCFYCLLIEMILYIMLAYFARDLFVVTIYTMFFVSIICFCVTERLYNSIFFGHHVQCLITNGCSQLYA